MLTVEPYPYQDQAIDMALERGNLLIAYGMGLGKTLVQIAICEELLGQDEVGVNVIVVPSSLKYQWASAIAWATDVDSKQIILNPRSKKKRQEITVPEQHQCVVVDGDKTKRKQQYEYIRENRPDYVILGYASVVSDWRWVKRIKPDLIALDEATAIKSFNAGISQQIKLWDADYRFALTGTPIDNRPEELFSIMEWVDPTELGHFEYFDLAYIARDSNGRPKRYKNLDILHQKTKRFIVRKTRFDPDVAPYMPKDYERKIHVEISGKTKELYADIAQDLIEKLREITGFGGFDVAAYYSGTGDSMGSAEQGDAMARYGALAMLCDHPQLLVDSANKFADWWGAAEQSPEGEALTKPSGSKYAWALQQAGELDWINDRVKVPKFEEALEQIQDITDERPENKVIVFSFAKAMLRLFQTRLDKMGIKSVIYDGDMNSVDKEAAKQNFKTDPKVRVFLSSDAGGMGVDLPEANYLINYNHPWSAGKADQRNSRHIRAGSKWGEVWVLNMIATDTVEEWKFNILDLKRRVGSAIIDGTPTKKGVIDFDVASLLNFLEESAL